MLAYLRTRVILVLEKSGRAVTCKGVEAIELFRIRVLRHGISAP
ncbi:hypothetical protein [Bradyrhizobium sp. 141]|nr:hypothetical protein [Bradyrhizobium sp. 141]